jgi:hypothetical protein
VCTPLLRGALLGGPPAGWLARDRRERTTRERGGRTRQAKDTTVDAVTSPGGEGRSGCATRLVIRTGRMCMSQRQPMRQCYAA